jgi:hypothetical protein
MRPAGCAAELPSSLLNGGSDNATLSRQRAKTVSSAVRIFLVAVLASLNSQPKKRKLMNYLFGYKVFAQGQNLSGRDERPQKNPLHYETCSQLFLLRPKLLLPARLVACNRSDSWEGGVKKMKPDFSPLECI